MRKSKYIFITILIILLFTAGCKNNIDDIGGDKEPVDDGSNPQTEDIEKIKIRDNFLAMIQPENTSVDLANYIRDNISKASKYDAGKMIEWLLIYQTETMEDFNNIIYEPEYIDALNRDMEGVLDQEKIGNISNERIREDYQNLIDVFLTIVRYEEHPAVETNWKELIKFSKYISKDLSEMIHLFSKIQNYEYNRKELDVVAIAEDLIKTEGILETSRSDFIEKKKEELYNHQIYALLVGPEGSYLDLWIDMDNKEYKEIISLLEKYPNSILAEIISKIDKAQIENIMDVIDIILRKSQFGLKSDNYIDTIHFKEDRGDYTIIEIKMPNEEDKQSSINRMIMDDVYKYIDNMKTNQRFTVNIYLNFEDDQYISYVGFVNLEGSSDKSLSFYRTLNCLEERYITLEDYLGIDYSLFQKDLEKISGKTIQTMPEFLLSDYGLDLFINEEDGMEGYIHLNEKDLVPYFRRINI